MSSSSKAFFSKAELESLDLWNAQEQFGNKKKATFPGLEQKSEAKSEPAGLTVNDIEAIQKQAYDEAYAEGKKAAYEEGLQQGIESGKKQGFEQGFKEGETKGYKEKIALLKEQAAEFVSLLESLSEPFKELDESIEQELLDLAIGIANQLIRREIKIDPGQIVAVIREAVNALPQASQQLTLHLHPADAELVRNTLTLDEISPPWKLLEEPLITRGGCKVETETSKIDATVENRLAAIVTNILGGERAEDKVIDSSG